MAKPALLTHPKFRRLVHELAITEAHAVGLLELLWHVAYETGNARIGDATDVELAARWCADDGKLCAALQRCGFLDQHDDESYSIHDLLDHAPRYVKDRWDKKLHRTKTSATKTDKKPTRRRSIGKENRNVGPSPSPPLPTPPIPSPPLQDSCPEPASPPSVPNPDVIVLEFPTSGKGTKTWLLYGSKADEYAASFPAVDVLAECRKARQWCIDNPTKRKTPGGMPKFLSGWLGRAQDRGGSLRSDADRFAWAEGFMAEDVEVRPR